MRQRTPASRVRPYAELETKVDFKRSCSGSGQCDLAAGGVDSQGNLATGVTRIFTGLDKTARSCELKTALGSLTRPAVKLQNVYPKPHKVRVRFLGPEDVNAQY